MSTEHVWNGLRVRRNERGQWMGRSNQRDSVWFPLNVAAPGVTTVHTAVVAELDKLYPPTSST